MMGKKLTIFMLVFALIGLVNAAFAQDAPSAASLYNDGLEKLKAKQYGAALPLLEKAIAAADSTSETDAKVIKLAQQNGAIATYYVGNDLRKVNKFDEALKVYNQGIEYNPNFYANYIGRAQALEGKGQDAEAVKAYLKAGSISEQENKADRAADMFKKAENLAAVAWGKKQWDTAIACAEAFLAEKETADAHYYLSQSLLAKKELEKALEHAKKSTELAQGEDKDKAYFGLGEVHEALGQKDAAIAAYKMVTGAKYGERAKYEVKQLEGGE
ncbi:MAG: tetratricopeptide repeat protein [Saprospiraceae bacterium]|nr:tetratricopeptide repeat protein [Saprospiraceae bacterium]